jgi:hypothetical protein
MRGFALSFVAALGLCLMAQFARADQVIFTLDTNVGSYGPLNPPDPNGPWATATFTQLDSNDVELDLHGLPALDGSFISSWGFNSTDDVSDLTFAALDVGTLVKVAALLEPDTFYEPPFTPVYSFGFSFYDSTFALNPPFYFFPYYLADDLTFIITSNANPISAASFFTTGNTAPYYTEALIKDSGGGVWGASTGPSIGAGGPAVPAPSSALAALVLMSGLGIWKLSKRTLNLA